MYSPPRNFFAGGTGRIPHMGGKTLFFKFHNRTRLLKNAVVTFAKTVRGGQNIPGKRLTWTDFACIIAWKPGITWVGSKRRPKTVAGNFSL